ncbi:MAG: hypothetical protein LBB74_06995 [Chitinispirillales bacterium]|jgi:hypothetical protein|nr:hypothetical protein [Chitinispirillales bacterium]
MLKKSIFRVTVTIILTALSYSPVFAVNAVVTDVNGQDYNVSSIKLAKGSKLKVVCGKTRMEVPFNSVSVMKIARGLISSVEGQLYFGVEIRMSDGAVVGGFEGDMRCAVNADNGLVGKVSKSKYSSPLGNVSAVSIVGKADDKKGGKGDDEDESEE